MVNNCVIIEQYHNQETDIDTIYQLYVYFTGQYMQLGVRSPTQFYPEQLFSSIGMVKTQNSSITRVAFVSFFL